MKLVEQSDLERSEPEASLALLRRTTKRWLLQERSRGRVASGIAALDALLAGGWPQGRIGELVGPPSAGRAAVAAAAAAAATGRGEVVAWIDGADTLDPASLEDAGVHLERVLWIRPAGLVEAVRAVELVLDAGGFPLVVLDLPTRRRALEPASLQAREAAGKPRSRRGPLRLRLTRAVERAGAVLLVLSERPWVGTVAGATVVLEGGTPLWYARRRGAPLWLAGLSTPARLERGAAGAGGRRTRLRLTWRRGTLAGAPVRPGVGRGVGERGVTRARAGDGEETSSLHAAGGSGG